MVRSDDGEAEQPAVVAVIGGTGALGFGLAVRMRQAGVPVVIGSRAEERAVEAAGRLSEVVDGPVCTGSANEAAAAAARIVVVAVPFASQAATVRSIAGALGAGQIVGLSPD